MQVLGINKILGWVLIISGGRRYNCHTQNINGVEHFFFKKEWHKVAKYLGDHATELVSIGGKVISRPIKK